MSMPAPSSSSKVIISDPASAMMIVDRDSNDIAFMDLKSRKILGRTFLGNNVNPHMAMMSPDGRYVVTGGTRANTAYVIDARTLVPFDWQTVFESVKKTGRCVAISQCVDIGSFTGEIVAQITATETRLRPAFLAA